MPFCAPHCFPTSCTDLHRASCEQSKKMQCSCHSQLYENKGNTAIDCGLAPVNRGSSGNSGNSGNRSSVEGPLAEFELLFVYFQGLDPVIEGRCRNSELGPRPGRSGNPASSLS